MQLAIDETSMEQLIDQVMKKRGYVPENQIIGKTISIDEFINSVIFFRISCF